MVGVGMGDDDHCQLPDPLAGQEWNHHSPPGIAMLPAGTRVDQHPPPRRGSQRSPSPWPTSRKCNVSPEPLSAARGDQPQTRLIQSATTPSPTPPPKGLIQGIAPADGPQAEAEAQNPGHGRAHLGSLDNVTAGHPGAGSGQNSSRCNASPAPPASAPRECGPQRKHQKLASTPGTATAASGMARS